MRYFLMVALFLLVLPVFAQDIPDPMPLIDEGGQAIINVLLIGSATDNPANPGLTDSMLVVSFNQDSRHTAIVSIPRDLYVYMPHFGMGKLNQAYYFGEQFADDAVNGVESLKETLTYNLGIEIDYYARVNFSGFQQLIDQLGGIDITVDCTIEDWRLKSPELDKTVAENYEKFTLDSGMYTMDGDTALWYVRSRKTSTDLDRGRRQQDVLRAIWRKIRQAGLLESFPTLWEQFNTIVETDITLEDALALLPAIVDLNTADLSYFTFRLKHEVNNGYTDDAEKRFILVPDREAITTLLQNVVYPPTASQVAQTRPTVALLNATGNPFYDYLPYIAADRLELEGFSTVVLQETTSPRNYNYIIDYTGETKGNPIDRIMRSLATTAEGVQVAPDPNRTYDYKIYIGFNYQFLACTRAVIQPTPQPEITPTPNG